jgi:hypothetical protein
MYVIRAKAKRNLKILAISSKCWKFFSDINYVLNQSYKVHQNKRAFYDGPKKP